MPSEADSIPRGLPPTVHVTADVDLAQLQVKSIDGHPGRFYVALAEFGDLNIHTTAAQWDKIDTAVRAGIAALIKEAS